MAIVGRTTGVDDRLWTKAFEWAATRTAPAPGPRRRTAGAPQINLNYAAVGATVHEHVLLAPPDGFRATQSTQRIGSGAARFDVAGRNLMTWGAFRGAGIAVEEIGYEDIADAEPSQALVLADGTPWITAGMTATLVLRDGRFPVRAKVKILGVVDEPGRIGYLMGTCQGSDARMEWFLVLEHRDDDTVVLQLRCLADPSALRFKMPIVSTKFGEKRFTRRCMAALHPTHSAA